MASATTGRIGKFTTTEIYLSGGICGCMWWPQDLGGFPIRVNLDAERKRFTEAPTLRELLLHVLMAKGGDFQNALFTADTRITIIRRRVDGPGKYSIHVRERELPQLGSLTDLVEASAYTGDFLGEC